MSFLQGLLAVGAAVAGIVGAVGDTEAQKKTLKLAEEKAKADEKYKRDLIKREEKMRKKQAIMKALRVPGEAYVKGILPPTSIVDPGILKARQRAGIFSGVSSALEAVSQADFSALKKPKKGTTPGVAVNYDPTYINPYA